jgi:hypothetical protein
VIYLFIEGRYPLAAAGQMDLPKEPPFAVLTPGDAVNVQVQLEPESPNSIRLFDAWYWRGGRLDVVAGDGKTWVRSMMSCIGITKHQGIQATRAWSPPERRHAERGTSSLYRSTPRFQPIARDVHRYVLATDRYEWAPAPAVFAVKKVRDHAHSPN